MEGRKCTEDETKELEDSQEAFADIINDESDGFLKDGEKPGEFLQFVYDRWSKHEDVNLKSPLVKQYYKTIVRDEAGVDGQSHFNNISGRLYFQYKELDGGHPVFEDGYSTVIKHFCNIIDCKCQVLYESKATEIYWNDGRTNHVHVNYDTSEGKREILVADMLVVTLPLGYLKSHHRSLFIPPLPQKKVDAINK